MGNYLERNNQNSTNNNRTEREKKRGSVVGPNVDRLPPASDVIQGIFDPSFYTELSKHPASSMGEGEMQKKKASGGKGNKTSLPDEVLARMEKSFSTDFSDVEIHKDSEKALGIGAHAYTEGSKIYFAPGKFNPNTQKGLELIAHELAHVVQQRQGRVAGTHESMLVNNAPDLEKEANTMGEKATRGEVAEIKGKGKGIQKKEKNNKQDGSHTDAHQYIIDESKNWNYNESKVEWTTFDILKWKTIGGKEYLFRRKSEFVRYYKKTIIYAAKKYDIPDFLLAGVAFTEFGGDPMWIDDVAYGVRSFDWSGPNWVDNNLTMTSPPKKTSFGNLSIQVRTAAASLGYDPKKLNSNAEKDIVSSLKNPIQNIFIAAKHLSDLRDVDYKGVKASELSEEQIKVIATRYNRGPNLSIEKIKKNMSYGNSIYRHKDEILVALSLN